MSKNKMSSSNVLSVLEAKLWTGGAHEMLREVRNATGYGKTERYADALVVSCWPSRGIWFAGVEVKVARGDWKRELDDPAKSAEIQRFCSYWWVAAPAGVVQLGELPETWGFVEVEEKTCKVVKDAPKLTPEPPTAAFVASLLRNAAQTANSASSVEYNRGYREAEEKFGGAQIGLLERTAEAAMLHKQGAEKALRALQEQVWEFERETGFSMNARFDGTATERFKKSQAAIAALANCNLERMAEVLRSTANAIATASAELHEAKQAAE